ncbi:hypothetical protein ISS85_04370 [Candidatus Microgenomates bacterium]|nr:hypothetical protein [Candidatus Microgenomates bacterium]
MKNTNTITALIIGAVLALVSVLAYQSFNQWLEIKKQVIKNQAVDECLVSSRYTTEQLGDTHKTIIDEPNEKWYHFCMEEKGYEQKK